MAIAEKRLMLVGIDGQDDLAVLDEMAQMLLTQGYVRESYVQAVKQREREFPTGIKVADDIAVAIPHADMCHVAKTGICFATLRQKVPFALMGNADQKVGVDIVVMLAIDDPKQHMEFLARIMDVFSDAALLRKLRDCKDADQAYEMLSFLNK